MKKAKTLVKAIFGAALLTLFLGTASCKKEVKEEDPKEVAEDENDAKFDENDAKEDDSSFLVDAAETNLAEIEIGKLAQSKSTNAHVKEIGKMLVTDHSKALADLQPFADKKQISLPTSITEEGKEHYNELNEKSGTEFDEKFADMMAKGHEDAISKMEKASEKANDVEIRTWATNMVPTLKSHLEHVKKLQDELKNKK